MKHYDEPSEKYGINGGRISKLTIEVDGLKRLIAGKATLIRKAVSAESLDITVVNNNIVFPWFTITDDSESDETAAYKAFIAALVDTVRWQYRYRKGRRK